MKIDVSQSVPNLRAAVRAALERLSAGETGQIGAMANNGQAAALPGMSTVSAKTATSPLPSPSLHDTGTSSPSATPLRNQEISR